MRSLVDSNGLNSYRMDTNTSEMRVKFGIMMTLKFIRWLYLILRRANAAILIVGLMHHESYDQEHLPPVPTYYFTFVATGKNREVQGQAGVFRFCCHRWAKNRLVILLTTQMD